MRPDSLDHEAVRWHEQTKHMSIKNRSVETHRTRARDSFAASSFSVITCCWCQDACPSKKQNQEHQEVTDSSVAGLTVSLHVELSEDGWTLGCLTTRVHHESSSPFRSLVRTTDRASHFFSVHTKNLRSSDGSFSDLSPIDATHAPTPRTTAHEVRRARRARRRDGGRRPPLPLGCGDDEWRQ